MFATSTSLASGSMAGMSTMGSMIGSEDMGSSRMAAPPHTAAAQPEEEEEEVETHRDGPQQLTEEDLEQMVSIEGW